MGCVLQNLLHHILGPAIRIGALTSTQFFCVRDRCVFAVDGCRRTEYNVFATVFIHHFKQCQRGIDIVSIILNGHLHRLAYCLEPSEVNDNIDCIFGENFPHCFCVLHIGFVYCRSCTCYSLYSVYYFRAAVVVVICDYYFISCSD